MTSEDDGAGNGNLSVQEGAKDVFGAAVVDGEIEIGDFGRAYDAALGMYGGAAGPGVDGVDEDVADEAVDGAAGLDDDGGGTAATDGEVRYGGVDGAFYVADRAMEVAGRGQVAANALEVGQMDGGEDEVAEDGGGAERVGDQGAEATVRLNAAGGFGILHVENIGDGLALA